MKKSLQLFMMLFVSVFFLTVKANSQTLSFKLFTDNTWKSSNTPGIGWEQPGYDDSGWPFADSLAPDGSMTQFNPPPTGIWNHVISSPNITYLRKTFTLTNLTGPVMMDYAVDDDAQIYINGQLITSDNDCFADGHFGFNITPFLNLNGSNTIAVQASDCGGSWTFAAQFYKPLPVISIADKSITEGNSGTKQMSFKVTLNSTSTSTVTVNYTTINGSAVSGSDYVTASGTIKIKPGKTKKAIKVLLNGDTQAEPDEQFTVQLSAPVNATIADNTAVGTIRNDDAAAIAANSNTSSVVIKTSPTIKVSPNPAKDQITISGLSAGKTNHIELTDLNGRSLLKQKVTGNTTTINIAKYAAGVYLLRYYDGSKWQQVKIVKG